ncbi:DUF1559 domain-containing protein [Blastopirellula sp. JC732]|uniref:DUF1559 domain-containing protein n=1 Tax=Blastopirellula sediminis TaxID=2894196 RepID=A0A9X1SH12_9BACT|nr:DUF1559 domain-containing protein [Blastopirellula sediminis]MCC9605986.1 DUF1559 domain-containing protein [Blastopirellula sediminis]MCC9630715.1 DUF1559 domain-containing protein [Blastopirellula sediminis]
MQLSTGSLALFLLLAVGTASLHAQDTIGVEYLPPQAALAAVVKPQAIHSSPLLQMVPWEVLTVKSNEFAGLAIQDIQSALLFATPPGPDGKPQVGAVVKLAKPVPLDSLFPPLREAGELVPNTMANSDRYLDGSRNLLFNVYPVDQQTYLLGTPNAIQAMLAQQRQPAESPMAQLLKSDMQEVEFQAFLDVRSIREMAQFLLSDPQFQNFPDLKNLPQQLSHAQLIGSLDREKGGVTLKLTARNEDKAKQLEMTVQGLFDTGTKAFGDLTRPNDPDSPEGQAIQQYTDRVIRTLLHAIQPTRSENQVVMTTVGKPETSPQMLLASGTAVLVPMIASAKATAYRSRSTNNLKQMMLALHNYYDTHQKMPSDSYDANGKPLLSWRVHILPYIEQAALYQQFHLDEPWDSEHNRKLINTIPVTYLSPGEDALAAEGRTRYERPLGEGLPASKKGDLTFADMTDGTSNTLAIIEVPSADAVIWTRPDDFEVDLAFPIKSLLPGDAKGMTAARYDGSVQYFVKKNLTDELLKALLTYAGGEVADYRD